MYAYSFAQLRAGEPPAPYLKSGGRRLLRGGRAAPDWPESFPSRAA